ncbi:MAG: phosphoribosylaminoimidazolesuccinocarboxamide synthase, partial [Candidatus Bathyarchaeia archaeon]
YRRTIWAKEVEEAKKIAREKGIENWRTLVKVPPPKLDPRLKTLISQMYMAAANELTGRSFFDVPKLADIVRELQNLLASS